MICLLLGAVGHLTIEPGFVPHLDEASKIRGPAPFLTLSKLSADDPIDAMMDEAASVMVTYMDAPSAMVVDWQRTAALGGLVLGTAVVTGTTTVSGLGMVSRCHINMNASIADPNTFLFVALHELIHCFGHGSWDANATGPVGVSAGSLRVNLDHWDCMNFTTGFEPVDLIKFLPAFSLAETNVAFETRACVADSDCGHSSVGCLP